MILLWGIATDEPLEMVRDGLDRRHEPCLLVDQQAILDTEVDLVVDGFVGGRLRVRDQEVALEDVRAAYLRPYDSRRVSTVVGAGVGSEPWQRALAVDEALLAWAEVTPALVVNRPSAMASNGSKPYQASLIRAAGFAVPPTLVTTDPEAVVAFWELHGSVVYKSVSGVRSIVTRLTPDRRASLTDVTNCPTQFQAHIPGRDYRVHVLRDLVFASEVISPADDYRYGGSTGQQLSIRARELSAPMESRCVELTESLGLTFAGIDLRMTPHGEWYCFEVNPSPGFTFYEDATGQLIGEAVADLLSSA